MSAPRFLRGNFSDLFGSGMLPVLEELFRSELDMHPSRREEICKIVSTDRDIFQTSEIHDMPLFASMSEGEDYSFEAPKAGANKTIVPVKFGLGFSISEEAVDDGKFDFIADAVRKLAKSAKESQEIAAMNLLNNAFGTETIADGLALCHTAHTLPSGLTYSNRMATDADLSVTSLETVLNQFETGFIGDSGIIYNMQPQKIIVHPSFKRLAKELIGSDLKVNLVSDASAPNNMNSFKEEGLRIVSSPHLTDADAWFMQASADQSGLRVVSRKPIETKAGGADSGFINDSILYKSRYREKVAAVHGYGIIGSSGA